jgi:hypothetical protein
VGVRFRRRVRIAPGVSLNISKSGLGIAAGPRGLKIGAGPRGTHYSVGAPGTGLHYRKETRNRATSRAAAAAPAEVPASAKLVLLSDGTLELRDPNDQVLAPRVAKLVREAHGTEIQAFLEERCASINGGIDDILRVHLDTPSPLDRLRYEETPHAAPEPAPFVPREYGLLDRLSSRRRARVDAENAERRQQFELAGHRWADDKMLHEEREARRKHELEVGLVDDEVVMERVLEERLVGLAWPRETNLSFQLNERGRVVLMDVDLPEIEDMPRDTATVAARGLKLNLKQKSETQVRKEYMQFIHGIVFRVIGEAFFALPLLDEVIASAYSQRPDPTTGNLRDDYLLSTRVRRSEWQQINFDNLASLDVVACLERFELRRKMTKTGVFQPVEPIAAG